MLYRFRTSSTGSGTISNLHDNFNLFTGIYSIILINAFALLSFICDFLERSNLWDMRPCVYLRYALIVVKCGSVNGSGDYWSFSEYDIKTSSFYHRSFPFSSLRPSSWSRFWQELHEFWAGLYWTMIFVNVIWILNMWREVKSRCHEHGFQWKMLLICFVPNYDRTILCEVCIFGYALQSFVMEHVLNGD